jgi:hypothetical protein
MEGWGARFWFITQRDTQRSRCPVDNDYDNVKGLANLNGRLTLVPIAWAQLIRLQGI